MQAAPNPRPARPLQWNRAHSAAANRGHRRRVGLVGRPKRPDARHATTRPHPFEARNRHRQHHRHSTRHLPPGERRSWTRPSSSIRGRDIVVDLTGAELVGSTDGAAPDTLRGARDPDRRRLNASSVKNARFVATRSGSLPATCTGSTLIDNDCQRQLEAAALQPRRTGKSRGLAVVSPEREGRVAALRRRHLPRGVADAKFSRQSRAAGQNGLMITGSRALRIWNNDFSFLSGVGLGLYRTTDSTIMHNRIDWCVRGYSHGFYNRGQDSAGLLMYEQSSRNVVAYNSVTHGGDGLFLWAGQTHDGHRRGRRQRQSVLRQRLQSRADQRYRGNVQPQHVRRQPGRGELARRLGRL